MPAVESTAVRRSRRARRRAGERPPRAPAAPPPPRCAVPSATCAERAADEPVVAERVARARAPPPRWPARERSRRWSWRELLIDDQRVDDPALVARGAEQLERRLRMLASRSGPRAAAVREREEGARPAAVRRVGARLVERSPGKRGELVSDSAAPGDGAEMSDQRQRIDARPAVERPFDRDADVLPLALVSARTPGADRVRTRIGGSRPRERGRGRTRRCRSRTSSASGRAASRSCAYWRTGSSIRGGRRAR